MVLAGSETSSTCLSTITYHLFKSPHVLQELRKEIRGTFKSYGDINAASTVSLKYMHAVILEGLRIYPPLPFALPRVVPEGSDTVDLYFLLAGVRLLFLRVCIYLLTSLLDYRIHQSSCSELRPG